MRTASIVPHEPTSPRARSIRCRQAAVVCHLAFTAHACRQRTPTVPVEACPPDRELVRATTNVRRWTGGRRVFGVLPAVAPLS